MAVHPVFPCLNGDPKQFETGKHRHKWSESDTIMNVRGPNYLSDKKKIGFNCGGCVAELMGCDIYESETFHKKTNPDPVRIYAKAPGNYVEELRKVEEYKDRFFVVMHWRFAPHGFATIFMMPEDKNDWPLMFKKFIDSKTTTSERNTRFKIIPNVVDGPWIVRKSVGANPAIIGKGLKTDYVIEDNLLEISVDVFSSRVAKMILGVCAGAAKVLVVEVAVLLESQTEEELPEQILGISRLIYPDMSKARNL